MADKNPPGTLRNGRLRRSDFFNDLGGTTEVVEGGSNRIRGTVGQQRQRPHILRPAVAREPVKRVRR